MLNREEHKGFWSPADKPEIRFHATLSFGPDKSPRLNGVGLFTKEQATYLRQTKEMTFFGDLEGGVTVTLFECNSISILLPFAGHQNVELNAHIIVFGAFLRDANEMVVGTVKFGFTVLSEWMKIQGYKFGYEEDSNTHELTYQLPEDIPFTVNERLKGAFSFRMQREAKGMSISLRQENFIILNFEPLVSFEQAQDDAWKVQRFLTIAVWQQMNITDFSIKIRKAAEGEEEDKWKWCRVFFRQSNYGLTDVENETYFLRFNVIQPVIEGLLKAWFRLEELTDPVISLLIANTGGGDGFVQNNFLNLAQAVEAFHRHVKQDTDKLKAEHKLRMNRIIDQIDDAGDKEWVNEKLEHSYEPSLRKRLKELFLEHSECVFYKADLPKKLLARVIDTITEKRNYYTHYGEKDSKKDPEKLQPKGAEKLHQDDSDFILLIELTQLLRILLAVMMFSELGMEKELLRSSISGKLKINLVVNKKEKV